MDEITDLSTWLDLTQKSILQLDPKHSIIDTYWTRGVRCDGRLFTECRPYTVQHGVLQQAAGSALVKCGGNGGNAATMVMAAVTVLAGQPAAIAPKQGDVMVSVTKAQHGSSSSSSTPMRSNAENHQMLLSIQSFLQRTMEENINLQQLMIVEGKIAYRLSISVVILHENGSLLDVCLAATTAALLDTQLPLQPIIENDIVYAPHPSSAGVAVPQQPHKYLHLPIVPCCLTALGARFHVHHNDDDDNTTSLPQQHYWIVDPDSAEQQVQESSVTIVVNAAAASGDDDNNTLLGVYFGPSSSHDPSTSLSYASPPMISTTELAHMMHMATSHGRNLNYILQRP